MVDLCSPCRGIVWLLNLLFPPAEVRYQPRWCAVRLPEVCAAASGAPLLLWLRRCSLFCSQGCIKPQRSPPGGQRYVVSTSRHVAAVSGTSPQVQRRLLPGLGWPSCCFSLIASENHKKKTQKDRTVQPNVWLRCHFRGDMAEIHCLLSVWTFNCAHMRARQHSISLERVIQLYWVCAVMKACWVNPLYPEFTKRA